MHYKSEIYQLNSLRLGLIDENNLYGKPTVFFTIGSQHPDSKNKIGKYINLNKTTHNCVAIPYNFESSEPGDNYDIIQYYENTLKIDFFVTEKLDHTHVFFSTFGLPQSNFTEYHFDDKTKFIGKFNG